MNSLHQWAEEMRRSAQVVDDMHDVNLRECAEGNRHVAAMIDDLIEALALLREIVPHSTYTNELTVRCDALLAKHPEKP